MRVVHICSSLNGGAGLCASRIIEATKALGIDAKAIVQTGCQNKTVSVANRSDYWSNTGLLRRIQAVILKTFNYPKYLAVERQIDEERRNFHETICFTSPLTSYTHLTEHPWIMEADIVHLHWIGGFVDYPSFFQQIEKPIVWTVHDENPGQGGFHYSFWKNSAPKSFQLLDDELAAIKKEAYNHAKSITLVAISDMMADYFRQNQLLGNFPMSVIHNGVDGSTFTPIDKSLAREALGVKRDEVLFLFVAQNIHEERKGLTKLLEALKHLNIPKMTLLCLGHFKKKPTVSFHIRCEGFIPNTQLLTLYYSAANYLVMPSNQEAFAQTPMEAMACGTPTVLFPCSGARDIINEQNGIVCRDFTVEALVQGLKEAMSHNYSSEHIRQDILKRFSYDIIARQYFDLYKKVIRDNI